MRIEVYCDETRPDLFTAQKPKKDKFLLIGSLWLPSDHRSIIKQKIIEIKDNHKVGGQIKWQRVGPKKVNFYFDLIDLFKSFGNTLRFRCFVVDSNEVDFPLFHNDDRELGFYKFYYQLLHHWILDFNEYYIFCDTKTNRRLDRLKTLKNCLSSSNLSSKIISIQPIPSKESALIQ